MPSKIQFPIIISAKPEPPKIKLCSECEYSTMGAYGVFCGVYREEIWDETVAGECQDYNRWIQK